MHLFGDGFGRWYDKSFTLTFTNDGNVGVNFEHTWGDGQTVLRYANETYKDSLEQNNTHLKSTNSEPTEHIKFNLSDSDISAALKSATVKASILSKSVSLEYLLYNTFGANFAKKHKCSPDALLQVAYQRAYYKYSGGKRGSTYESCSMKHFIHGRTDVIRSFTKESRHFASLNNDGKGNILLKTVHVFIFKMILI